MKFQKDGIEYDIEVPEKPEVQYGECFSKWFEPAAYRAVKGGDYYISALTGHVVRAVVENKYFIAIPRWIMSEIPTPTSEQLAAIGMTASERPVKCKAGDAIWVRTNEMIPKLFNGDINIGHYRFILTPVKKEEWMICENAEKCSRTGGCVSTHWHKHIKTKSCEALCKGGFACIPYVEPAKPAPVNTFDGPVPGPELERYDDPLRNPIRDIWNSVRNKPAPEVAVKHYSCDGCMRFITNGPKPCEADCLGDMKSRKNFLFERKNWTPATAPEVQAKRPAAAKVETYSIDEIQKWIGHWRTQFDLNLNDGLIDPQHGIAAVTKGAK